MGRTMVRFESRVTKSYLVAYNLAQFLGWVYVFVKLVVALNRTDYRSTYTAVGGIVSKLQVIAFLEVLHAGLGIFHYSTGLVRSDPNTALMQWAGRTHVLLAVIDNLPQVQTNLSVCITFASWATTEIVRYPWYALSGIGQCPKWLTYVRYTIFIVLYPAGVSGEMYMTFYDVILSRWMHLLLAMYAALGPIRDGELSFRIFDSLPGIRQCINFVKLVVGQFGGQRHVVLITNAIVEGVLTVYPLLFSVLYRHMFKRRQARLFNREGGPKRVRKDR